MSVFVAQLLTGSLQRGLDVWNTALQISPLIPAISSLAPGEAEPDESFNAMEQILLPGANAILTEIADMGPIVADGPHGFRVPEMLRGTFARRIVLGMTFAAEVPRCRRIDRPRRRREPIDDPAVQAEMERFGIVHTPGMAAEMLRELAPLLAEEGIDLDNPTTDPDAVNTALARATERYNLELFTPVGESRAMALTVHRLATEALAEGSLDLARVVIDGIQPEPVGNLPSVAQVIGVGLGALDTWHRDPAGAKAVARAQVLEWDTPAMRAARDILQAARRGDAFGQLQTFHQSHGGERQCSRAPCSPSPVPRSARAGRIAGRRHSRTGRPRKLLSVEEGGTPRNRPTLPITTSTTPWSGPLMNPWAASGTIRSSVRTCASRVR